MMERWQNLGIETLTGKKVTAITSTGVTVEEEGKSEEIAGETVVLAIGAQADDKLVDLKDKVSKFFMIGDCVKPRKIMEAVYEGTKVGCEI
jgi:2,4-dienoyl-CoA reductase (NADPH2)